MNVGNCPGGAHQDWSNKHQEGKGQQGKDLDNIEVDMDLAGTRGSARAKRGEGSVHRLLLTSMNTQALPLGWEQCGIELTSM